jgi:hypothetical protein
MQIWNFMVFVKRGAFHRRMLRTMYKIRAKENLPEICFPSLAGWKESGKGAIPTSNLFENSN